MVCDFYVATSVAPTSCRGQPTEGRTRAGGGSVRARMRSSGAGVCHAEAEAREGGGRGRRARSVRVSPRTNWPLNRHKDKQLVNPKPNLTRSNYPSTHPSPHLAHPHPHPRAPPRFDPTHDSRRELSRRCRHSAPSRQPPTRPLPAPQVSSLLHRFSDFRQHGAVLDPQGSWLGREGQTGHQGRPAARGGQPR